VALRDEHFLSVDKLMGLVRAAFPRDRARQDLIFPVVEDDGESGGSSEDESGGPAEGSSTGEGGSPA
jgi:hypothetical protein